MTLRSRIVLGLFGATLATSPVFAGEPTPAPKPDTQKVETGKVAQPAQQTKLAKVGKMHRVNRFKVAPTKIEKAPAPTPDKTKGQ